MDTPSFIAWYIRGCASGAIKIGECGPVWQLTIIALLLLAAIVALVFMRIRASIGNLTQTS